MKSWMPFKGELRETGPLVAELDALLGEAAGWIAGSAASRQRDRLLQRIGEVRKQAPESVPRRSVFGWLTSWWG